MIYIKPIIYGSQAPFRLKITECLKTFMNQAWHHCRAEGYYLCVAAEGSKVKLGKSPNIPGCWRSSTGGRSQVDDPTPDLCAQYLHTHHVVQTQPGKMGLISVLI